MTAPRLAPGHVVGGKYTIQHVLGIRSEVSTYHATAVDGGDVVVRLYDAALGQRADVMAALERDRALASQLSPAGVAQRVDSGYDANTGAPFVVTERVLLHSLQVMMQNGPLSLGVVGRVLHGIAAVLDEGQRLGLHHLSLKPTNIFVGPAPDYAVRLTDFEASTIARASPTTHESYALSANWWAPEQLQPSSVLGAPTDVFAAALIAFRALTGKSYWRACQNQPPDLPTWQTELMGARSLASDRGREVGGVINPNLDAMFARALSVQQGERPSSVAEIAAAIDGLGASSAAQTLAFPEEYAGAFDGAAANVAAAGGAAAGGAVAGGAVAGVAPIDAAFSGLPAFPTPVKAKRSDALKPILIGVGIAALFGSAAMWWLLSSAPTPMPMASASAPNAQSSPPGGESKDGSTPGSSSAPPGAASADPTADPTADASAAPSASAVAEGMVVMTVTCSPACDRVEMDGKVVQLKDDKLEVAPGPHKLRLVKGGYLIQDHNIVIEDATPFTKEYPLVKLKPLPRRKKKKKNCGQFFCP